MKSVYEPGIHTALDDSNPDQMIGRRLYHGLKSTEWDRPPSGLLLRRTCSPRRFMPSAGERCPKDILVDVFETTRITMVRWCAPRTSVRSPPKFHGVGSTTHFSLRTSRLRAFKMTLSSKKGFTRAPQPSDEGSRSEIGMADSKMQTAEHNEPLNIKGRRSSFNPLA